MNLSRMTKSRWSRKRGARRFVFSPRRSRSERFLPIPKSSEKLLVRLLERPDEEVEIAWGSIDKVELFEQLVLAEANRLTSIGNFDEAFDYFAFLSKRYPETPGLDGSRQGLSLSQRCRAIQTRQTAGITRVA